MRGDRVWVEDMLAAIEQIQQRTVGGKKAFESDPMLQVWVVYHLQVVGEAAAKVSAKAQGQHPKIPWPAMIGLRNALVHGYFKIDHERVWRVVEENLPVLKQQLEQMLNTI